jgi:uncharacterized membrane-anchored protein
VDFRGGSMWFWIVVLCIFVLLDTASLGGFYHYKMRHYNYHSLPYSRHSQKPAVTQDFAYYPTPNFICGEYWMSALI